MSIHHPRIQLNVLPADCGDCIHLRFQSSDAWHNVIIDSGPAVAAGIFRNLLKQIYDHKEVVDLLCFSHIDNDHIKGAAHIMTSAGFNPCIVRQIWLNVPDGAMPPKRSSGSYRPKTVFAANHLLQAIVNHGISCKTRITAGDKITIGDACICAVLPTPKRLGLYYLDWEKSSPKTAYRPKSVRPDSSPTNGSSIALLCTIGTHRILLTGDAFPEDLVAVGMEHAGVHGFSVVKLPHHGSDANLTLEMLSALKTQELIISTKETAYHPGKNAMKNISAYAADCGGVTLYGNYYWPRYSSGVPNVSIINPQNEVILTKDRIEVFSDANSILPFSQ